MRHRFAAFAVVIAAGLALAGSALAFDCIRVSSSLQGLQQSTKSGNWLLFDLSSPAAAQQTFAGVVGLNLTDAQAQCFTAAYRQSGQPLYFALGIGVAGGEKGGPGVLAGHNKNENVLANGKGIDHFEDSPILPAIFGAAGSCGIEIPEE